MVEEDEWTADDASEKTDRTVNTGSTELEVSEATELKGAKLRIYIDISKRLSR